VFRRESLYFINEQMGQKPFFLYLAFNAPHSASSFAPDVEEGKKKAGVGVQAPEKYMAMYRDKVKDEKLARYYGAVTCMDEAIGAVMDAVEKAGQTENTIFLFMSDNGGSGNGGNAPLKGNKSTMWEGGLRVPFIARWPGKLPAGKVTDEFLTSLELVPTLVAATGAQAPEGVKLDGFDMMPILRGEAKSPREEMFWQRRDEKAARIGNWKWSDSAKAKGLYDLSTDIGETKDLSKEKPEVVKMMKQKFADWQTEMVASEPRGPFRDY